jgi:hypothetical protein
MAAADRQRYRNARQETTSFLGVVSFFFREMNPVPGNFAQRRENM